MKKKRGTKVGSNWGCSPLEPDRPPLEPLICISNELELLLGPMNVELLLEYRVMMSCIIIHHILFTHSPCPIMKTITIINAGIINYNSTKQQTHKDIITIDYLIVFKLLLCSSVP